MRFGGLQKNSLIDFPGKISCVVFVSGCNFHCPYCHNPELLSSSPTLLCPDEIFNYLEKRTGLLDAVVISGGEPALQEDLADFCKTVKAMGYLVKIDTNGSRPQMLREIINAGLADYLAMDIKTTPDNYSPAICKAMDPEIIAESIGLMMASNVPHEFRTTCVRPLVDEAVITRIADLVTGARLYALQEFRNQKVLDPDYMAHWDPQYGEKELSGFKKILGSKVGKCVIR